MSLEVLKLMRMWKIFHENNRFDNWNKKIDFNVYKERVKWKMYQTDEIALKGNNDF